MSTQTEVWGEGRWRFYNARNNTWNKWFPISKAHESKMTRHLIKLVFQIYPFTSIITRKINHWQLLHNSTHISDLFCRSLAIRNGENLNIFSVSVSVTVAARPQTGRRSRCVHRPMSNADGRRGVFTQIKFKFDYCSNELCIPRVASDAMRLSALFLGVFFVRSTNCGISSPSLQTPQSKGAIGHRRRHLHRWTKKGNEQHSFGSIDLLCLP